MVKSHSRSFLFNSVLKCVCSQGDNSYFKIESSVGERYILRSFACGVGSHLQCTDVFLVNRANLCCEEQEQNMLLLCTMEPIFTSL
jgi:hypothetical protein